MIRKLENELASNFLLMLSRTIVNSRLSFGLQNDDGTSQHTNWLLVYLTNIGNNLQDNE